MIDEIIAELNNLKEAKELLERVWVTLGPYYNFEHDDSLSRDIANYMKFDDSE